MLRGIFPMKITIWLFPFSSKRLRENAAYWTKVQWNLFRIRLWFLHVRKCACFPFAFPGGGCLPPEICKMDLPVPINSSIEWRTVS